MEVKLSKDAASQLWGALTKDTPYIQAGLKVKLIAALESAEQDYKTPPFTESQIRRAARKACTRGLSRDNIDILLEELKNPKPQLVEMTYAQKLRVVSKHTCLDAIRFKDSTEMHEDEYAELTSASKFYKLFPSSLWLEFEKVEATK